MPAELLNVHKVREVRLHEKGGSRGIVCPFPEELKQDVYAAMERRVAAWGHVLRTPPIE